jgi:uncharacterized protein (DUF3084 family)
LQARDVSLQARDADLQARDVSLQTRDADLQARDVSLQARNAVLVSSEEHRMGGSTQLRSNRLW